MRLITFKRKDDKLQYWVPVENISYISKPANGEWITVTFMDTKDSIVRVSIDQTFGIKNIDEQNIFEVI